VKNADLRRGNSRGEKDIERGKIKSLPRGRRLVIRWDGEAEGLILGFTEKELQATKKKKKQQKKKKTPTNPTTTPKKTTKKKKKKKQEQNTKIATKTE